MRALRSAASQAIALIGVAACGDILGPDLPRGAVRFDPLPVYAEWWRMTEQCSGVEGDFSRIKWYVVFNSTSIPGRGPDVQGIALPGRIVIVEPMLRSGPLVRHEMLHELIGGPGHPRQQFIARCGGIVACEGSCVEGEAPDPPENAVLATDEQLEVSISMWPDKPSGSTLGGYFRLTVTALNTLDVPIVVQLPESGDAGPPGAFRYRFGQGGYGVYYDDRAWWPEVTRFAAGESKNWVFDFWTETGEPVVTSLVGTWQFSGGYGAKWSAPISVTITP